MTEPHTSFFDPALYTLVGEIQRSLPSIDYARLKDLLITHAHNSCRDCFRMLWLRDPEHNPCRWGRQIYEFLMAEGQIA